MKNCADCFASKLDSEQQEALIEDIGYILSLIHIYLAGTMLGWMLTALLIRFLQKSKPANVGEKSLCAYISEKCVKQ